MRIIVSSRLSTLASLFALSTAVTAQSAKVWSYDELAWKADSNLPSVQSVLLWGDPATGDHAMLRKFPGGFAPPPHRHPATERVVVVSGTILLRYAGSHEKKLGPGSYSEIPAGMVHAVKCLEGAECVFVLASPGAFAIIPAAQAEKK
jgi:mannose-6-phosphate isomerase-like protein (cupin superfamily)